MTDLVRVKCLAGWNFVRPDRVIALQTSQTGAALILMEGGISISSTELTTVIARRLAAAGRKQAPSEQERVKPLQRVA
jgi:hypothetical protein